MLKHVKIHARGRHADKKQPLRLVCNPGTWAGSAASGFPSTCCLCVLSAFRLGRYQVASPLKSPLFCSEVCGRGRPPWKPVGSPPWAVPRSGWPPPPARAVHTRRPGVSPASLAWQSRVRGGWGEDGPTAGARSADTLWLL